jgi:threonine/homoserine/homoserine lactone efflux protein
VEIPAPATLALFAIATFLLTVSPGPGVLYVTARSVSQGRRAGFASMFGIEAGEVVWIAAAATGVAALLAASEQALDVLRYAGAAYLIFLAIQRWREVDRVETADRASSLPAMFAQGLLTQLINPKVAVFFVAFLPQFLDPSRPIAAQVAALGLVYIAIAVAVDTCYVLAASALSAAFMRSAVARRSSGRIAAVTYAALGVAAAASGVKRP